VSRQLLSDAVGLPAGEAAARPATDGLARHGVAGPQGQVPNGARYGRMLRERRLGAQVWDRPALDELAKALFEVAGDSTDNFDIPAGYTYFGQFVDHDATFDPTSRLRRRNDPESLVDFRTPALDLDSLYGSGPMDQPYLYDFGTERNAGVKLLVGGGREEKQAAQDLPRNQQGHALTGDPRNDENLIVAQLHLLMIRFHNHVVDDLAGKISDSTELFERAQQRVRWHYQWVVMEDFLPKIVGEATARQVYHRVRGRRPDVTRRFFRCTKRPYMPVEFSGAAYRFGHSMIRDDYKINDATPNAPLMQAREGSDRRLAGGRPLPDDLVIQWKHFFPTTPGQRPQSSKMIDPSLAKALFALPPDEARLVRLNLLRGHALGLPSGQRAARRLGVAPLTRDELLGTLPKLKPALEARVLKATPLWLYVLCEAKALANGEHLGPAGGRIVAEVLAGMLAADPSSYVSRETPWTPEYANHDGEFTMTDLVGIAGDGTA
jgi:hypothetical protein